jgi:hypothetical protein
MPAGASHSFLPLLPPLIDLLPLHFLGTVPRRAIHLSQDVVLESCHCVSRHPSTRIRPIHHPSNRSHLSGRILQPDRALQGSPRGHLRAHSWRQILLGLRRHLSRAVCLLVVLRSEEWRASRCSIDCLDQWRTRKHESDWTV